MSQALAALGLTKYLGATAWAPGGGCRLPARYRGVKLSFVRPQRSKHGIVWPQGEQQHRVVGVNWLRRRAAERERSVFQDVHW